MELCRSALQSPMIEKLSQSGAIRLDELAVHCF
jgi:hypothetical protein